jgi:hypothetical protein
MEIERVRGRKGEPEEIIVEAMEDRGLGRVGENRVAIVGIQNLDLIFLKSPRGTKVKIAGFFIPESAMPNLGTLPPIRSSVSVTSTQVQLGKSPEVGL